MTATPAEMFKAPEGVLIKKLRFAVEEDSVPDNEHENNYLDMDKIKDVFDAIEMCEDHDVPYDGLEDIEDFIERLRLHFIKHTTTESARKTVGRLFP